MAFLALVSPAFANDDQLIYSDRLNNGWQDWGWIPHYATNSPVHSSTNSICLAPSSGWQAWWLVHDDLDTVWYTNLVFWINGGASGGQSVGVNAVLGLSGSGLPRLSIAHGKLDPNVWQQIIIPLSDLGVADKTNFDGIQIWSNTGTVQSNFYVADIRLVANPPPAIVHVGINATNPVRLVDPRVFGINTAAWDGAVGSPNTIAVLTNMGNQALRWPGGSWGDVYHWTNEAWNTGATSPRNWGSFTTNFMYVATNTHAQVFMIANYGSGSPQEAAFGVRMCNVTNHCHFKYWEIGNEVGGSWEEDDNTNAPWQPHDPWTYAMRFKEYYDAMKAVDPTIKIGAVADPSEDGTVNYTNHPVVNPRTGVTHYGWTPVMLTTMRTNGVTPDFLIEHNYAPGDGDTYILLWAKRWAHDAKNLRQMLNDYLGANVATNIELVDTEYGPPGGDKQYISLVGGLFAADAIGEILQTEFNAFLWWDLRNGVSVVANSDNALYGWRTNSHGNFITDGGCINGDILPPNPNCYPSFYCMKLMKYFARGGDTVVKATNDYELLGTYSVRRTNGSLTVLIINKSSYANLNAAINLAGYVPSANATVYSYGIPQDDAVRTGIGSLDIVQTNFAGASTNFSYVFPPYSATVLVLAPAAPSLVPLVQPQPSSGQFAFQLQGQAGVPYVIESSTNLASPSWAAISTNTTQGGSINLTNVISSGSRLYRAVWQP